jgi:hypothetical protein
MRDDLVRGVELFNRRQFFESHDAWEEIWMEERGEGRLFIQGLIQAAVGCYHALNANYRGSLSQYEKSLAKLSRFAPAHEGIDVARLIRDAEACRDCVRSLLEGDGPAFTEELLPTIVAAPLIKTDNQHT